MSILEPSIATPEQHDATELNNLNNANGELSVPKNTLDELTSLKVAIPIDEFKEEDQKVFEDENGHITKITRKIYSQGILYGHVDFTFSNDSAGKFYMTSVTVDIYNNGKIKDSCSVFLVNTNEQGITEVIETSYVYHKDYTLTNSRHYDKDYHLTKTVVENKNHSGSNNTSTISYNKDDQITEVINESNDGDSTRQVDVIRFSYNKNKQITKTIEKYHNNSIFNRKVTTKYSVVDNITCEVYKSSIISIDYNRKGVNTIKSEYFDRHKNKTEESEKNYTNNILDDEVIKQYTVLDSNSGEAYKSVKFYIKYSVVGRYRVKAEYFNEQGNIINNSDALYVNDILSFISEDYFNDSEILERNVTINTNYDPDGNVIGYKQYESKYNERGKLIDSQNTEYDIYGQEIINIKDKAPIGPGMNSLIEAIGSFSAQESVFSSIDYHEQGNMLNTFVATINQFEALQ